MKEEEGLITKHCPICQNDYIDHRVVDPKNNKELLLILRKEPFEKPCSTCKENMKRGVIVLTYSIIVEGKPVRSGGYFTVKEDGIRLMLRGFPEEIEEVLKRRVMFISDEQAINFGFYSDKVKTFDEDIVPNLNDMN